MLEKVIKPEHKIKDQLLQIMIDNNWSDMYITVWTYPWIKIGWEILRIDEWVDVFSWKDTLEFAQSLITEEQHDKLIKERNLDFSFSFWNRRFRWNISFQMWNYMVILRLLTAKVPDIEKGIVIRVTSDSGGYVTIPQTGQKASLEKTTGSNKFEVGLILPLANVDRDITIVVNSGGKVVHKTLHINHNIWCCYVGKGSWYRKRDSDPGDIG